VVDPALVGPFDRLGLELDEALEHARIFDGLEQRILRLEQDGRELRIEMAPGATADHGRSGGAAVTVVGDLDDVPDLVEAHREHHCLALYLAGRPASIPALAELLEGVHDAGARSDDLGELRRSVADGSVELFDVIVVGDDAGKDPET